MILSTILSLFISGIKAVLWIIPTVPQAPSSITNGGDWLIELISGVASMLQAIYGGSLLTGIIAVLIGLLAFEYIYFAILWAVKKIPMIGIK